MDGLDSFIKETREKARKEVTVKSMMYPLHSIPEGAPGVNSRQFVP
jgi:hypothetical protein